MIALCVGLCLKKGRSRLRTSERRVGRAERFTQGGEMVYSGSQDAGLVRDKRAIYEEGGSF